jgi:hypothetical protein
MRRRLRVVDHRHGRRRPGDARRPEAPPRPARRRAARRRGSPAPGRSRRAPSCARSEKSGVKSAATISATAKTAAKAAMIDNSQLSPRNVAQIGDLAHQRLDHRGRRGRPRPPRDPAEDRQRLAHEAARIGEDRRDDDHQRHDAVDEGEAVHVASLRVSLRRTLRLRTRSGPRIGAITQPGHRPRAFAPRGSMAAVKPSFRASFNRFSVWATGRSAPERLISPKPPCRRAARRPRAPRSAPRRRRGRRRAPDAQPPATLR